MVALGKLLLVVVLLLGFIFRFHNESNCNGDWGDSCNSIPYHESEVAPDRLDICIKNGYGVCYWEIGIGLCFSDPLFVWQTKYAGNWKDNKKDGLGTYYSMSGVVYDGNWENDKREGYGKLILPDQSGFVSGVWRNDQLTGASGTLQQSPEFFYRGNVNQALMHGTGTLTLGRFEIFARFANGSLFTDVGDISNQSQKLFTISLWNDVWEWGVFSANGTVQSELTKTVYSLGESMEWNLISNSTSEIEISQNEEIQTLNQLLQEIKEFEGKFLQVNMQITQQPYQF